MNRKRRLPEVETERRCKTCQQVKPLTEEYFRCTNSKVLASGEEVKYFQRECRMCYQSKKNQQKREAYQKLENRTKPTAYDWTRPKPGKSVEVQDDVLKLVDEIRVLIGADCKAQERITRYVEMVACEESRAVGRGALMMMLNDAKVGVK